MARQAASTGTRRGSLGRTVKIYEKLAAFIEDFEKVGTQMDWARAVFMEARKKLHTIRGNGVAQVRRKGKLGYNKPDRDLLQRLVEEAEVAEDSDQDRGRAVGLARVGEASLRWVEPVRSYQFYRITHKAISG